MLRYTGFIPLLLVVACVAPPESSVIAGVGVEQTPGEPVHRGAFWADTGLTVNVAGLNATFAAENVLFESASESWGVHTRRWGRAGSEVPMQSVDPVLEDCMDCTPRLLYPGDGITEWWIGRDSGVEQGWTLSSEPVGSGPLILELEADVASVRVESSQVGLIGENGGALLVSGLVARDATGTLLPSRFVPSAGGFSVEVDDEGAVYPVEIDPAYTLVNFDDRVAPCLFANAGSPNAFYTAVGLTLTGAFEVLNYCGSFGVSGYSSPNFLAWNTSVATGSSETFTFSSKSSVVTMNVGSSQGGSATVSAYTSTNLLLTSQTKNLSTSLVTFSVTAANIDHVVFTTTAVHGVIDDVTWTGVTDADGDGYDSSSDCNDSNAAINPGAQEVCDTGNTDEDCDGLANDNDPSVAGQSTWYADADADSFGNPSKGAKYCYQPSGYVSDNRDCDDTRATTYPGATEFCNNIDDDCDGAIDNGATDVSYWYADADSDSFGDPSISSFGCTAPTGYVSDNTDCDDTQATVYPGATETPYDGIDQDCDGSDWIDVDGDGYSGEAVGGPDCWDGNAAVYPGAPETVDGVDEDCDGLVDEGTNAYDDDGDGYTEDGGDCDDADAVVAPGATEIVDHLDNDCDSIVDEGTRAYDDDGDGYTEVKGDCNDADAAVNPGATEVIPNNLDDDCDGVVDSGERDRDGDGVLESAGDCDDRQPDVAPNAPELPDGIDNDCDGIVDEGTVNRDDDGDGVSENEGDCDDTEPSVNPAADETADGRDNNCDSVVDEGTDAADDDGDGFTENGGDCDDTNAGIAPSTEEMADGLDNDCDGAVDEGIGDDDADGVTVKDGDCNDNNGWVSPTQIEVCDGLDNDCNSKIDDGVCADTGEGTAKAPGSCGCDGSGGMGSAALGLALVGLLRRRKENQG